MGGTALSSFFTPRMVQSIGYVATYVIIAVALAVVGVIILSMMRDSPSGRRTPTPWSRSSRPRPSSA